MSCGGSDFTVRCVQLFLHLLCVCVLRRFKCWALDEKSESSLSTIHISLCCYCCSEKSDRTCEAELYGRPIRKGCYSLVQLSDDESLCVALAHTVNQLGVRRRVQPFYFMILLLLSTKERKRWRRERERESVRYLLNFLPLISPTRKAEARWIFMLCSNTQRAVELLW